MTLELKDMRVAITAADGVERVELEQPRGALYGAAGCGCISRAIAGMSRQERCPPTVPASPAGTSTSG